MKSFIALLAISTFFTAAPLYAEGTQNWQEQGASGSQFKGSPDSQVEGAPGSQVEGAPGSQVSNVQRDECLLYSKRCLTTTETLQTKAKKLHNEIQKGTRAYTPQELKRLEEKLKEVNDTIDHLLENP